MKSTRGSIHFTFRQSWVLIHSFRVLFVLVPFFGLVSMLEYPRSEVIQGGASMRVSVIAQQAYIADYEMALTFDEYYSQGQRHFESLEFGQALVCFELALLCDPDHKEARRYRKVVTFLMSDAESGETVD